MEFEFFHAYNKLARRGITRELRCSFCEEPFTLVLGKDDQPNLMCYFCDSRIVPGQDLYDTVRAVVKEHSRE